VAAAAERLQLDPTVTFSVRVEGDRRPLHPIVFDEIMAVTGEALFNAFTHAQADKITVDVHYERLQLLVRVRDDGGGMEPQVVEHGRDGHYGLAGMRERAAKVRGQLAIRSAPGRGTDVVLTVPARLAYARPARPRRFSLSPPLDIED
jgi:signal transduction histidine kinase